jgi:hypothetical protein
MLFAALGLMEDQFSLMDLTHIKLQYLADAHPSPCQELKHQSIVDFGRSENDFVNGFFVNDFPFFAKNRTA